MKRKFFSSAAIFLSLFWVIPSAQPDASRFFPAPAEKKFSIGEKLIYEIHYLGIPVGRAISEIKEVIPVRGRKAYHIQVTVQSYRAIDFIYKVRDEHHSYVDVETLASLEYEKKLQEGRRSVYERLELDQEKHRARYYDRQGKLLDEISISENSQDALSCGYFARTLEFLEKTSIFMPVHADKRNWNLEVKLQEKIPLEIKGVGNFETIRIEPLMEFQGIFIRKGKVEGWISLDKRRVPIRMKVRIPVLGNISAELVEYEPGQG